MNKIMCVMAIMASVRGGTCITGINDAQRVGMRYVRDSMVRNTALIDASTLVAYDRPNSEDD